VELYVVNNTVRITTGSGSDSTVCGVVPPGKTLEIAGSVVVTADETLDVQGVLHILENGELSLGTDSVLLVDRSGAVRIDGFVYEEDDFFPVTGGLDPRVSFGPNGGIVVDDTAGAAIERVNWYFTLFNRVKWNAAEPLSDLAALDKWVPGKTLILNGDADIETADISDNGALVVQSSLAPDGSLATGVPVVATIKAGETLTTNGIPVLIAENAVLLLENDTSGPVLNSALAGSFKINGTLTATDTNGDDFETSTIPPTVDLSAATLLGDTANTGQTAVFKFLSNSDPNATVVNIKRIDMTESLGIANTKGLIVDLIDNVADDMVLTLPNNVDTKVSRINLGTGVNLNIQGELNANASYAIVKPAAIYGGDSVTLVGTNILIRDPVDLASTTTIITGTQDLRPFGRDPDDQLAQLAKINGGAVDIDDTEVTIDSPLTLKTNLTTGSEAVIFAADTTLTRPITAASYKINANKTLTIGPYGSLSLTALTIGPGVYAAKDGAFEIAANGEISTDDDNATLTIGDEKDPAKLSFKSQNSVGSDGKFIPTASVGGALAAPVTLNGILGAIIVPTGGTSPGSFQVGATAELNLGEGGQIALANNATLGIAFASSRGGKISGFGTTQPATKADDSVRGTLLGLTYNGQLVVTLTGTAPFANGTFTANAIGATALFAGDDVIGPPPGAGAIFKVSTF
jgi:hypothetical protein